MQLERKYIREEERKAEEEMVGQCPRLDGVRDNGP